MNFIEQYRIKAMDNIFGVNGFVKSFNKSWKEQIKNLLIHDGKITPSSLLQVAENLRDIFFSTSPTDEKRSQGALSSGGTAFECLLVYFLNMGLMGSRSIAFRPSQNLTPKSIQEAYSISHNSQMSNSVSEPDILIITFPESCDMRYNKNYLNKYDGEIFNVENLDILNKSDPFMREINRIIEDNFDKINLHIIQSKTNWNDNAQTPMAWDIIYSSQGFKDKNIRIGTENYSLSKLAKYTYSFVTIPTQKDIEKDFKTSSISVLRVKSLSGGNYWCLPTKEDVAKSVFEILNLVLQERQSYLLNQQIDYANTQDVMKIARL